MIIEKVPLTLAEVKEYLKEYENEENKDLKEYLDKFCNIDKKKANELREKIEKLNNPKITPTNIVKLIDFRPQTPEEINKIFIETSLTEEETNAILEITKR